MIRTLLQNFSSNNRYEVRFAQSQDDVEAAQQLRFNVFNIELGEGLADSYKEELDKDKYDQQCDHLLVIEKKSSRVIGTYRMQSYTMARKGEGFYTEDEFQLDCIPVQILHESVEVGRACIEKDHRNGRVLYLLWRGLAHYLIEKKKRYLFGCCSLTSQSPLEAWTTMQYLKEHRHLHARFSVPATAAYGCEEVDITSETCKEIKLPQLFRLYMDVGAKVCSLPAIDQAFKTIDYLVLLDIDNLDERTKMLFFN